MRRRLALVVLPAVLAVEAGAHPGQGAPTWNREISRIVFAKCVSCHRTEGGAFPLLTYLDAQPRANAIKDAVLNRRMPPWGAVKGFGDFRNDESLSAEQIELIARWVDGGIRRGNNPNQLPPTPPPVKARPIRVPPGAVVVHGPTRLTHPFVVGGLLVEPARDVASARVVAERPRQAALPLVWLSGYRARFPHPFLLRTAITLPAGTMIRGVPADVTLLLLPPSD